MSLLPKKHPLGYCPLCNSKSAICDNDCGSFYCSNKFCMFEWYHENSTDMYARKGHHPKCGDSLSDE